MSSFRLLSSNSPSKIIQSSYTPTSPLTSPSSPKELHPLSDTIFALSSLPPLSPPVGVAVLRISGAQAFPLLRTLLKPGSPFPTPREATLRKIYDFAPLSTFSPSTKPKPDLLDTCLVLTFPGPNSFTGEDVVELHLHGSPSILSSTIDALSAYGRPANKGEFTFRAFMNNKLSVMEVEALGDLLVSETDSQRRQALHNLVGSDGYSKSTTVFDNWRKEIVKGLAHAEAVVDFADGEDDPLDGGDSDNDNDNPGVWGAVRQTMHTLQKTIATHLTHNGHLSKSRGEIIRDGLKVAIVGRPNAGKSSLINLICGRERAIVSSISGTTRDVVEVNLDLGGVKCVVCDTAGIVADNNADSVVVGEVEREGIRRARGIARESQVSERAKRASLVT